MSECPPRRVEQQAFPQSLSTVRSARHRGRRARIGVAGVGIAALLTFPSARAQQTQVVSVDSHGRQTALGESSGQAVLSENGRYVAFVTASASLVPGDTNGTSDVFVHDRGRGVTVRVSADGSGLQADDVSHSPALSADGRFVAFVSRARNLDPAATHGFYQVFVHDRDLDGNGVFDQDAPGARRTVLVSKDAAGTAGDGDCSSCGVSTFSGSCAPTISADGRYVAFPSVATNLDPSGLGDRNGLQDVFVHDRDRDGNGIFDEPLGIGTRRAALPLAPPPHPNGASSHPQLAAHAPIVVFDTRATDLFPGDSNGSTHDVVAWDFAADTFALVSSSTSHVQGDSSSFSPAVSAEGNVVAFLSLAGNLSGSSSAAYPDVFVRDRDVARTGVLDTPGNVATRLVTHGPAGQPAPGSHDGLDVSDDGAFVVFTSDSPVLVAGDGNGVWDVFHYSVADDDVVRVSVGSTGTEGESPSSGAALSGDGGTVSFLTTATNLFDPDTNGITPDILVRECPRSDFAATTYCAGKTSSAGCVPFLTTVGCASVTDPDPFRILGHDALSGAGAELIYGSGKAGLAWHCGTLCVKPPFERIRGIAGKSNAAGCTNTTLSLDFNGRLQSGVDPFLTAGRTVCAQYVQEDPLNPLACPTGHPDSLTDAVRFTIGP